LSNRTDILSNRTELTPTRTELTPTRTELTPTRTDLAPTTRVEEPPAIRVMGARVGAERRCRKIAARARSAERTGSALHA
jgi:hypothetical protein